jgi:hypothetical protein
MTVDGEPAPGVLHGAVEDELGVDVRELDPAELGDRCLRLRRERDRLEVAIARSDAELESSRSFVRLGSHAKASQWLSAQTGLPAKAARAAFRRARRLALLPGLQAAVIAGVVSMWHAGVLVDEASSPARVRALRDGLDGLLSSAAEHPRVFLTAVRRWAEEHFTAEVEANAVAVEDARTVSVGRDDSGAVTGRFSLHPVWGTAFATKLAQIERQMFEADWARAHTVHGTSTRFEHLGRSAEQRRADAMVEMALRAEAAEPGGTARRPLVSILSGFDGLRDRISEIEDGTYLTTDQTLRALRVADFEWAVQAPDGRVEISERSRLFRGATRRAVEVRDRWCTQAGCDLPPERCDIDHTVPHAAGGPTTQANGRLRCPPEHHGRRATPDTRPQPWEHAEADWDTLAAQRQAVIDQLPRTA